MIRKKLHLKTQKSHGIFLIAPSEAPKLEGLYEKYGIDGAAVAPESGIENGTEDSPSGRVDLGDFGDFEAE